jgi:hypothetical protein
MKLNVRIRKTSKEFTVLLIRDGWSKHISWEPNDIKINPKAIELIENSIDILLEEHLYSEKGKNDGKENNME